MTGPDRPTMMVHSGGPPRDPALLARIRLGPPPPRPSLWTEIVQVILGTMAYRLAEPGPDGYAPFPPYQGRYVPASRRHLLRWLAKLRRARHG